MSGEKEYESGVALEGADIWYSREVDGRLYWGNTSIELTRLTEEQKRKTKTNANYYFKRDGTDQEFFVQLDPVEGKFFIAETFDNDSHTVWLNNKRSVTYYDVNIVLQDLINRRTAFQTPEDAQKLIDKDYAGIKKNQENAAEVGFFKGLGKELRASSDGSVSMEAIFGIKDLVGAGLKKNKFLTLGATAGMVAVVAASPLAVPVAVAGLITAACLAPGAALHTALVTAGYTAQKVKAALSMSAEPVPAGGAVKSVSEAKNSISQMRKQAFERQEKANKNSL